MEKQTVDIYVQAFNKGYDEGYIKGYKEVNFTEKKRW